MADYLKSILKGKKMLADSIMLTPGSVLLFREIEECVSTKMHRLQVTA